jgi:hypothetical protein
VGDDRWYYKLAQQLTTIPECPRSDEAIEALARDLEQISGNFREAERIVRDAREKWDRWKGTRGLIELLEALRPAPLLANQAIDYGPRPAVNCQICGDWGYFSAGGEVEWCRCPAALETRERMPGLTDAMNRKKVKPPHESRDAKPVNGEDLESAIRERPDRAGRMIAQERAALEDPDASPARKEIAREILSRFDR